MKLLFVEDDKTIAIGLEYSLKQEGFDVYWCADISSAKEIFALQEFDLLLLDLSLPDGSGYELCKLAKEKSDTPVIFLTSYDDEVNVVMGLDMGADDYITKPFRIRELVSRIKSVLRRYKKAGAAESILELEDIKIDTRQARVFKKDKEINLTALEYKLFLTLIYNQGQVLTRNQLLEGIWDIAGDFVNDNTLTVYIKRLREKLEDNIQEPVIIKTIRGLGYKVGE